MMNDLIIFVVGICVSVLVFAGFFYSVTGEMQKQAALSRDTNRQFESDRAELAFNAKTK